VRGQPKYRSQAKPWAVGFHITRAPMTTTSVIEMGSRTFQATCMSWSTRRRGSVQRSHIITKTRNQALAMSQKGPRPMGPRLWSAGWGA